ncbi:MAG: 50S ribosomal protein L10 [Candidatus Obscuribacterales bacterium]
MATKEKKQEIVAELEALLKKTNVAIVADLSGFTVAEITGFRRKLDKDKARCRIAKNTLISLAAEKGEFKQLAEIAKGPTALILGEEDPAAAAKTTVTFFKAVKKGTVRGAVFEGRLMSGDEVKALADLPSREVLLSQIMAGLDSGAREIAGCLAAVIRDIAILAEEVAKKRNEGQPASAAPAAPAAEAPATTEAAAPAEEPKAEAAPEATAEAPAASEAAPAAPESVSEENS